MEDFFLIKTENSNNYKVKIIPTKIGEVIAYYAEYYINDCNIPITFKDHYENPFYFSSIDLLKEILIAKLV